jgi:hypothetical protein
MSEENVKKAVDHFENLVREQLERVERMKLGSVVVMVSVQLLLNMLKPCLNFY